MEHGTEAILEVPPAFLLPACLPFLQSLTWEAEKDPKEWCTSEHCRHLAMPLSIVIHTAPLGAGGTKVQAPGLGCAVKAQCEGSVLASATPARSVPSPGLQVVPCSLLCVQSCTNLDVNPSPTCHTCYQTDYSILLKP